jgi:hypothetical protein
MQTLGFIIFNYFLGSAFYTLAFDYSKNHWLFAFLGIISFQVGAFIGSLLFVLLFDGYIDEERINIVGSLFAIFFCLGFYIILKRIWSKQEILKSDSQEVIDDLNR